MASYRDFPYYPTLGTQLVPKSLKASFNKERREMDTLQSDAEQDAWVCSTITRNFEMERTTFVACVTEGKLII